MFGDSLVNSALNKKAGWKMENAPSAVCLVAGWRSSNGTGPHQDAADSGHLLDTAGGETGFFNSNHRHHNLHNRGSESSLQQQIC